MTSEIVRLTTENNHLQQEKQNVEEANKKLSNKAGSLVCSMTNVHAITYYVSLMLGLRVITINRLH